MSKYFNFWKMCYSNGWVTLEQVENAKDKGIITEDEYISIKGLSK